MKKQLEENEREMEAMNKSYEEKLAAALAAAQKVQHSFKNSKICFYF